MGGIFIVALQYHSSCSEFPVFVSQELRYIFKRCFPLGRYFLIWVGIYPLFWRMVYNIKCIKLTGELKFKNGHILHLTGMVIVKNLPTVECRTTFDL